MEVKLLTSTASLKDMEQFAAIAALTCHANTDKEFVAPDVLARIINWKHESVLEHITVTYSVKWLSRACLQELARHRHISLSVESTRHTVRKIAADGIAWKDYRENTKQECQDVFDNFVHFAWDHPDIADDELKYRLPECWPTNLVLTSNVRELRHIVKLRTAPAALKEFQELARKLFEAVPDEFKYLLEDCVYKAENRCETPKKQLREGE